ncbi:tubulin--tyrosine ligase-like protein 12 [Orussus abietinus]|uniref:tubulin--tyrosine ligase-like protein 12 n=1 Tax=Orussus abietinus TaxID=222816 RepID=UPI0006265C0A|nr:tubulin--tyrosine ligase-like protein 12 [Orussus abietinus]XP_012276051.1 tubulin--tyrosine ligase-like protein 12 [Orussus abietinus]
MDGTDPYQAFLRNHQPQLVSSGVPQIFWSTLCTKLQRHTFDAGDSFEIVRLEYAEGEKENNDPIWKVYIVKEDGISAKDPNNIFLVDHAWTYDVKTARRNLVQVPGLLDRMSNLMGFDKDRAEDEKLEFVLSEMWRFNSFFSLGNASTIEERLPIWYIMDELGSAINHSDDPNFRTVPFLYASEGVTYTLLFPIKDVPFEAEITRDYVEGVTNDPNKRRALLLPWKTNNFIQENFVQVEPDESYFLSGHIEETLPEETVTNTLQILENTKLKVYSQYSFVNEYLNDPAFEIVSNEEEADILWLTTHFKDYKTLSTKSPRVFVNQFPFEHVLTVKDLLSIICRRKAGESKYDPLTLDTFPKWLPTTYNLSTELVEFVSYFQNREAKSLDNYWICKPWNLARGLDTHITNNLYYILKLPATGPKVAQKYIFDPILYLRTEIGKVKFDIRYVVLLKSVKPLSAYVYTNFFLRFANKQFGLDNFDVYEQHFTVMNYSEEALCHIKCEDFVKKWQQQYPLYPWKEHIEPKIMQMLKEVFEAAVAAEPPKGIAHSPQSRALYAVDLMLQWDEEGMEPVLLEFNFSPDCKRACEYYPNFYNDIFKCLFLDKVDADAPIYDLFPKS